MNTRKTACLLLSLALIACAGGGQPGTGATSTSSRAARATATRVPAPPTTSPTATRVPASSPTVVASPTPSPTAAATATTPPTPTRSVAAARPSPTVQPTCTPRAAPVRWRVETVASHLSVPWSLQFAPDGRLFFAERPGRIRVIEHGRLLGQPVATLNVATDTEEGGQLGIALDPRFESNGYIYVMYTYHGRNGLTNRIARMTVRGNRASDEKVLLDGIPGAVVHDGGRLGIGPDGKLYASTGDALDEDSAQDVHALTGKILRLNLDGSVPKDNPFPNSPVYSYGHRNSEGFAWQPGTNRMYETENGPIGYDEVNLIRPGKNYGWPVVVGRSTNPRYVNPVLLFNPAIAPEGAAFYDSRAIPQWKGDLFFGTLRGEHLHRVIFRNGRIVGQQRLFDGRYGRIRAVAQGPDGSLYFTTSNRDGRGNSAPDDDRILRIMPVGRRHSC